MIPNYGSVSLTLLCLIIFKNIYYQFLSPDTTFKKSEGKIVNKLGGKNFNGERTLAEHHITLLTTPPPSRSETGN